MYLLFFELDPGQKKKREALPCPFTLCCKQTTSGLNVEKINVIFLIIFSFCCFFQLYAGKTLQGLFLVQSKFPSFSAIFFESPRMHLSPIPLHSVVLPYPCIAQHCKTVSPSSVRNSQLSRETEKEEWEKFKKKMDFFCPAHFSGAEAMY